MVINSGSRKIKFCDNTLQVMKRYIQTNPKSCEAGGILIGRENYGNSNLIIEYITEPMPLDRRNRYRYLRKDGGHLQFFHKLYEESNGIYGYIGEWHTHPETIPHYSCIDSKNWTKIGKEIKGDTQYHIIVGTEAVGIWEYNVNKKKISHISSIDWKRILTR